MPIDQVHDDIVPWRYGPAQCLTCGQAWTAAWPIGADDLHCPKCDSTDTVREAQGTYVRERQYTFRLTC